MEASIDLVSTSFGTNGDKSDTDIDIPDDWSDWIQKSFLHMNVGIIVSDMSGFTRLTREYGVIHFSSIIIRMRQVCLPILHHYGPLFINTEADDFIVAFPTAAAAVQAAVGMQKTIAKYNDSLPSHKKHFALTLNGVGVDFGVGPLMDRHGKCFGKTFSNAYALGEDLCEKGDVLVSGNVVQELRPNPAFAHAKFKQQCPSESAQARELAHDVGGLYTLDVDVSQNFSIAACDDGRYLPSSLMRLALRHASELSVSQISELDEALRRKYMRRRTVLMFHFEYEFADDPAVQMRLEFECLHTMRVTLFRYHAHALENELYAFDNPALAVKAALEIREQFKAKKRQQGTPFVFINGYGIHIGDMLLIPGTDVHWGDPVNTASKLGQDLATGSDILVSDTVYETVKDNALLQDVNFELTKLEKSKVTFTCYKASMKAYDDHTCVGTANSQRNSWHVRRERRLHEFRGTLRREFAEFMEDALLRAAKTSRNSQVDIVNSSQETEKPLQEMPATDMDVVPTRDAEEERTRISPATWLEIGIGMQDSLQSSWRPIQKPSTDGACALASPMSPMASWQFSSQTALRSPLSNPLSPSRQGAGGVRLDSVQPAYSPLLNFLSPSRQGAVGVRLFPDRVAAKDAAPTLSMSSGINDEQNLALPSAFGGQPVSGGSTPSWTQPELPLPLPVLPPVTECNSGSSMPSRREPELPLPVPVLSPITEGGRDVQDTCQEPVGAEMISEFRIANTLDAMDEAGNSGAVSVLPLSPGSPGFTDDEAVSLFIQGCRPMARQENDAASRPAMQEMDVQDFRTSTLLQGAAGALDAPVAQLSFLSNPQSGISVLAAHTEHIKCLDEDGTVPIAPAPSTAQSTVASPSNSRNLTPDQAADRDVSAATDSVIEGPHVSTFWHPTAEEESRATGEDVARLGNMKGGQIVLHPPKAVQTPMSSPAPPTMRLMNAASGSAVQFGYVREETREHDISSEFDSHRVNSSNAQVSGQIPSCEIKIGRGSLAINAAKTWAASIAQSGSSPTQSTMSYPCGASIHFFAFTTRVAPLIKLNAHHRPRMLAHLEAGDHVRTALHTYLACDQNCNGFLEWSSGNIQNFISKSFRQLGISPPSEDHTELVLNEFDRSSKGTIDALQCLCLFDALVRITFVTENAGFSFLSPAAAGVVSTADTGGMQPRELIARNTSHQPPGVRAVTPRRSNAPANSASSISAGCLVPGRVLFSSSISGTSSMRRAPSLSPSPSPPRVLAGSHTRSDVASSGVSVCTFQDKRSTSPVVHAHQNSLKFSALT